MTQTPKQLTRTPDAVPTDLLDDVLAMVRLAGAIFLRAEYTAPWAYESPPCEVLTSILRPLAKQLVLFHIIAEGECCIRVGKDASLTAGAGEVILIPYGDQHVMGSAADVEPVAIGSLLPPPPWQQFPTIVYGGGGPRTVVVCGYLHCDDAIFDPVVRALPRLFSVKPPAGPAAAWVLASIQYALEMAGGSPTSNPGLSLRLPELLFREVLRLYVEGNGPRLSGWLAALHDPVVGPALLALHREPARRWTADALAAAAACSRSTLNERFGRALARAPMQYLSEWRLQLAARLLKDTSLGVAAIAFQVGYESEEAFNRAFKRMAGKPPAQWRAS